MRENPVPVSVRRNVGFLIRIGAKVEHFRDAQLRKGLCPNLQSAQCPLLLEDQLPILITKRHEVAVVVEVEKLLTRAAWGLADQVVELIVSVEVVFIALSVNSCALQQPVLDIRVTRSGE